MGRKIRETIIYEGQQTDQQSKNQEEDSRLVVKEKKSLSKRYKNLLQKIRERDSKKGKKNRLFEKNENKE